jgi:hypothetical protein
MTCDAQAKAYIKSIAMTIAIIALLGFPDHEPRSWETSDLSGHVFQLGDDLFHQDPIVGGDGWSEVDVDPCGCEEGLGKVLTLQKDGENDTGWADTKMIAHATRETYRWRPIVVQAPGHTRALASAT